MNSPKDTIVAISTPRGEAAISVIRISGGKSQSLLENIFHNSKGQKKKFEEPRKIVVGYVVDPESGHLVDKAQAVFFRNPKTYTGEDMAEIYGHGGLLVSEKILEAVLAGGARLAERGEFTLRAFLNGKINLASAEAVLDVITARNEKSLLLSVKNLKGALHEKIKPLQQKLHGLLARIEVDIEYPDEGFELPAHDEIICIAESVAVEIKTLKESYGPTKALKDGIKIAFLGAPNVGKSSLMNRLLRKERAIVHADPGTTRDIVSDWFPCGGVDVLVMDTAGLTETDNPVEKEGVRRAEEISRQADMVLYVVDVSIPVEPQLSIAEKIKETAGEIHFVLNKIDLAPPPPCFEGEKCEKTSALTGEGVEKLREIITRCVEDKVSIEAESIAINKRQHDCLVEATEALEKIRDTEKTPIDILSIDLHTAAAKLGDIFGENTSDDVLHEIFSKFCIGK